MLEKLKSHKICSLAGRSAGSKPPTYMPSHDERLHNTIWWLLFSPVGKTGQDSIMQLFHLLGILCRVTILLLSRIQPMSSHGGTCLTVFMSSPWKSNINNLFITTLHRHHTGQPTSTSALAIEHGFFHGSRPCC